MSAGTARASTAEDDFALDWAMFIADKFFAERGNHSEAHLSKAMLAAMLAAAFNAGRKSVTGRLA